MSYPDHSRDEAATFDTWWANFSRKENLISPFPYCCRYKERGVMYCHNGHDCVHASVTAKARRTPRPVLPMPSNLYDLPEPRYWRYAARTGCRVRDVWCGPLVPRACQTG